MYDIINNYLYSKFHVIYILKSVFYLNIKLLIHFIIIKYLISTAQFILSLNYKLLIYSFKSTNIKTEFMADKTYVGM